MRMEIVTTPGGLTMLSDAYNASPTSMVGALETPARSARRASPHRRAG
jgi:UDP-N-acetylmuramyl pentapeptide synthase